MRPPLYLFAICGANFGWCNQTESPSQRPENVLSGNSDREVDRRQPAQRPKVPQMCAQRNGGIKSSTRGPFTR
ncbi:hypothetical protein NY08_4862 [Rhodococcus sp. B7740]|nr:hypothetical protein NY08_4862 [Rhodococcus sp. B7740]